MVLPVTRRPRPFWTVADPPVGRRDTTHGEGHAAPLERPLKLVPAVVWVRGVTCRSVARASDGAGAAPTAMTSGYPAGRGSQLVAVGAASLAGVRRRTAATPAGSLAGGIVPEVICAAVYVFAASAVFETFPSPTIAAVTPDTVPVNVGFAIGARVARDSESYRYLVESIRKFPTRGAFAGLIEQAGFRHVSDRPLSGGIVAIHSGWKVS